MLVGTTIIKKIHVRFIYMNDNSVWILLSAIEFWGIYIYFISIEMSEHILPNKIEILAMILHSLLSKTNSV